MARYALLLALIALALPAQAPPPQAAEIERLNSLVEELTALKAQVSAVETRIDALLRSISEQRGALQSKPGYNAITSSTAADAPDPKPPVIRCAALTSTGKRCTRNVIEGSRYCKQHALARQK